MVNNNLINGKQTRLGFGVVSIEIKDDIAEVFIQNEDGSIEKKLDSNKFWILCNENPKNWHRLKGDLHYKYGRQFTNRESFLKARQYLKTKDIFSIYDPKEAFMVLKGYSYYRGLKPKDISILSFDIETTTLEHNSNAKLLLISNTFRNKDKLERKLFAYDEFNDEGEMIKAWCKWVREIDPSIMCGHNINMFDLDYIQFIARKYDVDLELGRNGSIMTIDNYESKFRKDGSQFYNYRKHKIYGREIVDTLFLALKYDIGRKYESYGLKSIIKHEDLEVKDRQFYDASKIRFTYNNSNEWSKIKAYATYDADDALALFDLMSPSYFYSAQSIPKSFQSITEGATGSQINSIMIRAYLQNEHSLPKASESVEFEGAISIGNPGIYKNVFKVDIASLYPSIMMQYEVYDKDKDPAGQFLELVKTFTKRRLEHKKLAKETGDQYYKDLEQSEKILINSMYGFLGSTGLLFNSPEKAAFVTRKGREILQTSIDWAINKGYKLVNADTDSISFSKGDESSFTKEERVTHLEELNGLFPDLIRFEDDGYYPYLIVLKAKNYILQTEDGKVKIKGSALKDQKKEAALLEFFQDIINSILNGNNDYLNIYHKYIKEALNIKDIKRWSSKKTITEKVLNGTRANETKVLDAISNSEYSEGDKVWVFFDEDDTLKLVENYKGNYNKDKLLEKIYKAALTFENVIPKETFINYKLKKNKDALSKI